MGLASCGVCFCLNITLQLSTSSTFINVHIVIQRWLLIHSGISVSTGLPTK
jgi:hypothetical protein